jgi:ArsR family transcriptional regulator, arsenate/arsenite/antimonite-responsive transcriptional repressor
MKHDISIISKALSDMNRLRIFLALGAYDELCACQIIDLLKISGPSVSRHLSLLLDADLVKNRKVGRWIFFSLHRDNPASEAWLTFLRSQTRDISIFLEDQEYLKRTKAQDVLKKCCEVRRKNDASSHSQD